MDRTEYTAFETAFANALDGLTHPSSGSCAGCSNCEETYDCDEGTGQPAFSHLPCDVCRSTLGGDRYPLHAIDPADNSIRHFDACNDCVHYLAHGRLDDLSDDLPCLLCGGPLRLMGSLGYREWLRCSGCGLDFGREMPRPPTREIDP